MKFDFLRRGRAKAPEHKASATGALVTFRGVDGLCGAPGIRCR